MRNAVLVFIVLCVLPFATSAADVPSAIDQNWHQWRGPTGNGVAALAIPPIEWSEEKNVKWKVEVPGRGSATPIVWNDRVFVLTAIETDRKRESAPDVAAPSSPPNAEPPNPGARGPGRGFGRGGFGRGGFGRRPAPGNYYQFAVICFDRETGKQLWQRVATEEVPHEAVHDTNTYASASPITDGEHVFASFGSRGVYCYDMEGNLKWKRDLGHMQVMFNFGEGSSPALHGDTLVVPWDHEGESFIVALDATSGQTRWKAERDEKSTWATPLIIEHNGRTQVITSGANRVRSYDVANGEIIWEFAGKATNPIPSPVAADGLVYCMTGFRRFAIYAIPLGANGDITESDQVAWDRTDAAPYVPSPVLYKGQLYFNKSNDAILSSLDAKTGGVVIGPKRLSGLGDLYSSPVAAADRIYFTGRDGTTLVLKHGSTVEILATNKLDDGIDASPALVGNQLFLRGEKHLYCITEG